jgi:hypothetical protein
MHAISTAAIGNETPGGGRGEKGRVHFERRVSFTEMSVEGKRTIVEGKEASSKKSV